MMNLKLNLIGWYEYYFDVYDDNKEKLCNEMNNIYNVLW